MRGIIVYREPPSKEEMLDGLSRGDVLVLPSARPEEVVALLEEILESETVGDDPVGFESEFLGPDGPAVIVPPRSARLKRSKNRIIIDVVG